MNTRRKYHNYYRIRALLVLSLLINIILVVILLISRSDRGASDPSSGGASLHADKIITAGDSSPHADEIITAGSSSPHADKVITAFANEHHLDLSDWPDSLRELLEKNPETEEFVLQYPLKKDATPDIDLSEYVGSSEVPLFLQWDERWGYSTYGNNMMGLSGCGPTCLSMVCMYILNDAQYSPRYIADFAQQNGYCVPGNGSAWTLISEGGVRLGLDVTEIPLDENRIIRNLEAGNPIICIMGPGDFTTSGHFIVMTGCEDGKIKVNDPNSPARSGILWDYDAIKDQIRNLWVCR